MFRRGNLDFRDDCARLSPRDMDRRVDFDIANLLSGKHDSALDGGASPREPGACTPGHYWYSARGSKPKRSLYILCRGGPHDGHRGTGIGVISTVPTVIIDGRWVGDDLVLVKSSHKFLKVA